MQKLGTLRSVDGIDGAFVFLSQVDTYAAVLFTAPRAALHRNDATAEFVRHIHNDHNEVHFVPCSRCKSWSEEIRRGY